MGQNASFYGYALNIVQAGGLDFAVQNGIITLNGVGSFPYDKIQAQIIKQVYVAPVKRNTTLTFSAPAAVGEEFTVVIEQPTGGSGVFPISITVSATDTSATTIAQAFKTELNGFFTSGQLSGTASGAAAAITIEGTDDYPMLRVVGASAKVAVAVNAAGNPEVNGGAQLIDAGVEGAVAGEEYTTFTFQNLTPTGMIDNDGVFRGLVYAIDENASNASDLINSMSAVLAGGVSAASPSVANVELIGKLG